MSISSFLVLGLLLATTANAQPHIRDRSPGSEYSFIQQTSTVVSLKPLVDGLGNHDYHGHIGKRMSLRLQEATRKRADWTLATTYTTVDEEEAVPPQHWLRSFAIGSDGSLLEMLPDTVSPIIYKKEGTCSYHRQGLADFGGGMLECWRLVAPAHVWKASVGEWWEEKLTGKMRNPGEGVEQETAFRIAYVNGGEVDTLGAKAIRVQWRISSNVLHGSIWFPDRKDTSATDYYTGATIEGVSYFSVADGLLVTSRSTEQVHFQMLFGMFDIRLESETTINRGTIPDIEAPPAPAERVHALRSVASPVTVGEKLPPFSYPMLDAAATTGSITLSNETFAGKYYLIDFWATWCAPCVAELPSLQAAYRRFTGKGFDILSLSLDMAPEYIAKFCSEASHSMPWRHAILTEKWTDPIAQALGVTAIPYPVLVGPDGTILAAGPDELTGAALERTLEKHLGR